MVTQLRIGVFDSEYSTNNRYILHAITAAFGRHKSVAHAELVEYSNSLERMISGNLDVLVVVGNAANVHWQLPRWRAKGIRTVFWATEDPYELDNNLRYAEKFDLVFTNDLASLTVYGEDAHHLPLAGSLDHHRFDLRDPDKLDTDVLFVGTAWPNRVDALNALLDSVGPSLRLKVALPANSHIPKPKLNDPRLIYDWRASPRAFARLANKARITLTLGRTFSGRTGTVHSSTPPPRIFELGLAGTAQVFVAQSREIDRYYTEGTDLIRCPSIEEALPEIHNLLDNPDRRQEMALAMQRKTEELHCYDHRIGEILDVVAKLPKLSLPAAASGRSSKRRLLIVAHNIEGKGSGGGIEAYLTSVLRPLRRLYDIYVLTPENFNGRTVLDLILPDGISLRHETRHGFSSHHISAPEIEEHLFNIIVRHRIELVHFHHLLGMPLSLLHVAKLAGARTLFTAHDYYLICDNFNLISQDNQFCNFPQKSTSFCDNCLQTTKGCAQGSQAVRRNAVARALKTVDRVIFNTPYSRELTLKVYDIPDEAARIVEMLLPDRPFYKRQEPRQPESKDEVPVLRVKLPGNFTLQKGAFPLLNMMEQLQHEPIEFHILGREDQSVSERLDALNSPKIKRHGGYDISELPCLLADGDVSINFSIWPETYMISLSESWAAGLVPIVSELGATGERVTDGEDGFIVPHDDIGRMAELLQQMVHDRPMIDRMYGGILKKKLVRAKEHAQELAAVYSELTEGLPSREQTLNLADELVYDREMYGQRHSNNKWTDTKSLWDDRYSLAHLGSNPHVENIPDYPLNEIPLAFAHLTHTFIGNPDDKHLAIIKDSNTRFGQEHHRSFTIEVKSLDGLQPLVTLLRTQKDAVNSVDRLELLHSDSLNAMICSVEMTLPDEEVRLSLIIVYDGRVIEVILDALSKEEELENATNLSTVSSALEATSFVEGCDFIETARIEAGTLVVKGRAVDPVRAIVPPRVLMLIEDTTGKCFELPMDRCASLDIAPLEPICGYSGVSASVRLSGLQDAFSQNLGSLTLRIVQQTPSGRITSGTMVHIDPEDLDVPADIPITSRSVEARVLKQLMEALKSITLELDDKSAADQARLLTEIVDLRIMMHIGAQRKLSDHERHRLISYYLQKGEDLGDQPMLDFDPAIYREKNPEITKSRPLIMHFQSYGSREGRVACDQAPKIDPEADLIRKHMSDSFYHRQAFGADRFSGDLAQHYIVFGEASNLRPTKDFDPSYYRRANPDLAKRKICLFAHYLHYGRNEGRRPSKKTPIESRHARKAEQFRHAFDMDYYTSQVPYIRGTDIDPVCHYLEFGAHQGFVPNRNYTASKDTSVKASQADRFLEWAEHQSKSTEGKSS